MVHLEIPSKFPYEEKLKGWAGGRTKSCAKMRSQRCDVNASDSHGGMTQVHDMSTKKTVARTPISERHVQRASTSRQGIQARKKTVAFFHLLHCEGCCAAMRVTIGEASGRGAQAPDLLRQKSPHQEFTR